MPGDARTPTLTNASDELRRAALEQFATAGFAASSLSQIAERAGYAKSSVLYHFASKEALLEAAIGPTIDELELLVERFAVSAGADGRARFIDEFVDFLLQHRLAVHTFVNQGQSLRGIPVVERANAAIRRLADAIADTGDEVEQMRFGLALAGATYMLVAGATFLDDHAPSDDEVRAPLVAVLAELLIPAAGRER